MKDDTDYIKPQVAFSEIYGIIKTNVCGKCPKCKEEHKIWREASYKKQSQEILDYLKQHQFFTRQRRNLRQQKKRKLQWQKNYEQILQERKSYER